MKMKMWVLCLVVVIGVLGPLNGYGAQQNLTRLYTGTYIESYDTIATTGMTEIASGDIVTYGSGACYVADFDNDGFDEIYQISAGNDYYIKPQVVGNTLTGTAQTLGSFCTNSAVYAVGRILANDTREYLLQMNPNSGGSETLWRPNSDGSATILGSGNLDTTTPTGTRNYVVGDYDGDGKDDIWVIWAGADFVIDNIAYDELGNLTSSNHANSGVSPNNKNIAGYFIENGGRYQLLSLSSTVDYLFYAHDGANWTTGIFGSSNVIVSFDGTESLVVGDFDNDGFDELLVIRDNGSDLLYDNFAITDEVLSADEYAVDMGSSSSQNFAANFMVISPGDANGDGKVNVVDLGILATNYGTTGGANWGMGDFNNDSNVNVVDLGILATNYGYGDTGGADLAADSAKVFGNTAAKDDTTATTGLTCPAAGLPMIAGLLLAAMGLLASAKLEE